MKKFILTICVFLFLMATSYSQVGIGTETPTTALDVNGTVRIEQLDVETVDEISLTGLTNGNVLNRTDMGNNVLVENNELTTAPVSREFGDLNLGAEPIDLYVAGNPQINALDMKIAPGDENEIATFLRVHSYNSKYLISGIADGTEGRRMTIYFTLTENIKFLEDDPTALPKNRIWTLANSSISTSGEGFIEVVYDADAGSDGLGRWLVIKFRS